METINNLVEKVKGIFNCGNKRKRPRETSLEESLFFSIKRRRLSEPEPSFLTQSSDFSNGANKTFALHLDNNLVRKSNQTQIIKGREVDKYFFSNLPRNTEKFKRRLINDSNTINKDKSDIRSELNLNFSFTEDNNVISNHASNKCQKFVIPLEEKSQSIKEYSRDDIRLLSECEPEIVCASAPDSSDEESDILKQFNNEYKEIDDVNEFNMLQYFAINKRDKRNFPLIEFEHYKRFKILINNDQSELADNTNLQIESMRRLGPGKWLNDEVINFYIDLILKREEIYRSQNKDCSYTFIFNTFFYEKFLSLKRNMEYSYQKISKFWEKRNINLFSFKLILIPVNIANSHWSLVSVNIHERRLSYYDSLDNETEGFKIMNSLAEIFTEYISRNKFKEEDCSSNYLTTENRNKLANNLTTQLTDRNDEDATNKLSNSFTSNNFNETNLNSQIDRVNENTIDTKKNIKVNTNNDRDSDSETDLHMIASFWKYKYANVPKQNNGYDCGVFLCKFIDYLARDELISFTQDDIDFFRVSIGIQLMEGNC